MTTWRIWVKLSVVGRVIWFYILTKNILNSLSFSNRIFNFLEHIHFKHHTENSISIRNQQHPNPISIHRPFIEESSRTIHIISLHSHGHINAIFSNSESRKMHSEPSRTVHHSDFNVHTHIHKPQKEKREKRGNKVMQRCRVQFPFHSALTMARPHQHPIYVKCDNRPDFTAGSFSPTELSVCVCVCKSGRFYI